MWLTAWTIQWLTDHFTNTNYYKTNDVDQFTNSAYWMTDCPILLKDLSSDKSIEKQTDQLTDANNLRDLLTN